MFLSPSGRNSHAHNFSLFQTGRICLSFSLGRGFKCSNSIYSLYESVRYSVQMISILLTSFPFLAIIRFFFPSNSFVLQLPISSCSPLCLDAQIFVSECIYLAFFNVGQQSITSHDQSLSHRRRPQRNKAKPYNFD